METIAVRVLEVLVELSFLMVGAMIIGIAYLFFSVDDIETYLNIKNSIYLIGVSASTYIPSLLASSLQNIAYKWNVKLLVFNNKSESLEVSKK